MNKQKWSLMGSAGVGAGLGAGLMFLLDPQGGRRRRALARDKTVSALKTGGNTALKTGKHLGNRTKGLVAEASSRLRHVEHVEVEPSSRLARAWKPASLILAGTAGSALAIAGFKRRDKVGAALGAAGLGLLANSFTLGNGRGKGLLSETGAVGTAGSVGDTGNMGDTGNTGDGSVGFQSLQPSLL